jgi:hypothetical protein
VSLDLRTVHDALAQQLRDELDRSVTVYPFDPGDRSYPCIVVRPRDSWIFYHESFGDNALATISVDVVVMVAGRAEDALRGLADYASNDATAGSSVRYAVESDVTLGGTVANAIVRQCGTPIEVDSDGSTGVWELPFEVTIRAKRTSA